MASSTNVTTMWTPEGGYLNPANYIQGGGSTYLKPDGSPGVAPLNPNQFATDATAQGIAGNLGGSVVNQQITGPGMGYIGADGKPITQAQIQSPDSSNLMNAGLVANNFGQYGSGPTSRGMYNIAGNGAAPSDQTYSQWAMSQPGFKMDPTLGNSGPGYNYAWNPQTGTYTNTATGQAGITPQQATQQMQTANGVPATGGSYAGGGGGGSLTPDYTKGTYINGQWSTFTGSPDLTKGSMVNGKYVPFSSYIPAPPPGGSSGTGTGTGGKIPIVGGTKLPYQTNTLQPSKPITFGGNQTGTTPATGAGQSTAPNVTNNGYGFAPTGNATDVAPNRQYNTPQLKLGADGKPILDANGQPTYEQGNGNPYGYLQFNDPTQGPFNGQYGQPNANNPGAIPPYTGEDLTKQTTNNRNLALAGGAGLSSMLQGYTNYNAGQSAQYQQGLASAYAPIAAGQGGYTNEQMQAILNEPALQALQQTDQQATQNFLTPEERASISGDPYEAYRWLGQDEQALDAQQNMNAGQVYGYLGAQQAGVLGNLDNTTGAIRNTYNQTRGDVNSYIDPTALNTSGEYNANYQFGPGDEQAIREQAGRQIGNQELSDEERLLQQANQQGNTSPLALQAARDRMRQTGAVNQANAMSDAAIKAKQLALGVTQTRENTRLGAAQNYAQLGTANQQQLGAAQLGAEQYLGSQNQTAQLALGQSNLANQQQLGSEAMDNSRYKTTTNLAAGQQAETTASNRAAGLATNRQATEEGNQATQLARGEYIYGQNNATNTGFANQTLQQQQEYRNYLQNQQTQANQNQTIGNQQQLGVYGQTTGAANTATAGGIANYGTKSGDSILPPGLGLAEGGQFRGPVHALVGEAGPELILSFGHYGDGNSQKEWNGSSGRPEHMQYGFDPTMSASMTRLPGLEGGWPAASSQQNQEAQQAQQGQPNQADPGLSKGPTGAGVIRPKNNSIYNGIVSGLGTQQGALAGSYGGNANQTANNSPGILGTILGAYQKYAAIQKSIADSKAAAEKAAIIPSAGGGLYGTDAPVTMPPPQWPDVDSGVGGGTTPDDGGTTATVGPPDPKKIPTAKPKSPPTPTPKTIEPTSPPPGPKIEGGMTHTYIPPEGPPSMRTGYRPKNPTLIYPPLLMPGKLNTDKSESTVKPLPEDPPYDPGHTRIGPNQPGAKGGGGGTPSLYPYPPLLMPGKLNTDKSDSTMQPIIGDPSGRGQLRIGMNPRPTDPMLYPPIIKPGSLNTEGVDTKTEFPGAGTGTGTAPGTVITNPDGGDTKPATTAVPQGEFTSVTSKLIPDTTQPDTTQTSTGTKSYAPDPRTPWVDPNAWIPGGYGGPSGPNPGMGAENHPAWWDQPILKPGGLTGTGTSDVTFTPIGGGTGQPLPDPVAIGGGGPGGNGGMNEDELAAGGVISGGHHPYGRRGIPKNKGGMGNFGEYGKDSAFKDEPSIVKPKMPHMSAGLPHMSKPHIPGMPKVQLVSKPTLMTLGASGPSAVVPLTRRPGNHLNTEDIPRLISQYGGYGHAR